MGQHIIKWILKERNTFLDGVRIYCGRQGGLSLGEFGLSEWPGEKSRQLEVFAEDHSSLLLRHFIIMNEAPPSQQVAMMSEGAVAILPERP